MKVQQCSRFQQLLENAKLLRTRVKNPLQAMVSARIHVFLIRNICQGLVQKVSLFVATCSFESFLEVSKAKKINCLCRASL